MSVIGGKFTEIGRRVMGPLGQFVVNAASLLLYTVANFNLLFLFSAYQKFQIQNLFTLLEMALYPIANHYMPEDDECGVN
jgi:hypothetical protein